MIPQLEPALAPSVGSPPFRHALELAAANAEDVDRRARFPGEAIEALRAAGALGWGVPAAFEGGGVEIECLADATFMLSTRCAAAGMIFAMHQIQVASIARHAAGAPWFQEFLRRIAREQRLIASATSEAGVGGDIRRSIAALESDGSPSRARFANTASTVSYGAHADDFLTTVRRNPEAGPGDQVMVLTHAAQTDAQPGQEWDTLGMRGTCSPGFQIRAACGREQVLPVDFATIAAETMVPYSHLLWAHVWLGIASEAFSRAQNFVRAQSRQNPQAVPMGAARLASLSARMAAFRALVEGALAEFVELNGASERKQLSSVGYAVRINNLKIQASECAVEACQEALRICGFAGYGNCGPYSVGRHLRDACSATLMIANERLLATNSALLLVHREGK